MAEPTPGSDTTAGRLRVLVVENEPPLSELLCETLAAAGFETVAAGTVAAARDVLARAEVDVILLDMSLPDGSGLEVLKRVRDEDLPTEAIVLTGDPAVSTAIGAMKLGAYDCLMKPPNTEEIEALTVKAGEKARLRRENVALRVRLERQQPVEGFVTEDPAMKPVLLAFSPDGKRIATLAEMEHAYIKAVLERSDGRRAKAARALGIDPKTLYNKLGPEKPRG